MYHIRWRNPSVFKGLKVFFINVFQQGIADIKLEESDDGCIIHLVSKKRGYWSAVAHVLLNLFKKLGGGGGGRDKMQVIAGEKR